MKYLSTLPLYFNRRHALVFILGIFLPSLILGGLALRSASEQAATVERQTYALYQKEADELARFVRDSIYSEQRAFIATLRELLKEKDASELVVAFSYELPQRWPYADMAFVVTLNGHVLAPSPAQIRANAIWRQLLAENQSFIGSEISEAVYEIPLEEENPPPQAQIRRQKSAQAFLSFQNEKSKNALRATRDFKENEMPASAAPKINETIDSSATGAPLTQSAHSSRAESSDNLDRNRNRDSEINPNNQPLDSNASYSNQKLSTFGSIVASRSRGILARFTQDRLQLIFWERPKIAPDFIFGAIVLPERFNSFWEELAAQTNIDHKQVIFALLDEKSKPIWLSDPTFKIEKRQPCAVTEIGELLPHWRIAAFIPDPNKLSRSARVTSLIVTFLIFLALGAIAVGSYLVLSDTRRKMQLAQKKSDFVSNVSHELKTPLTSIRMFSELLQNTQDEEKRAQYLNIIIQETDRLTRLIHNVLDLDRMDRKQMKLKREKTDVKEIIDLIWQTHAPRLKAQNFEVSLSFISPPPYPVQINSDAILQVLINLLSNAEKYSTVRREIQMECECKNSKLYIRILDRGVGISSGSAEQIFEPFWRADDSLSSSIQGSGLGLTIARQIAREHGGDIHYAPREGGGSAFTLELPLCE